MNQSHAARPAVAIIVLTWNQKSDTLECLESLTRVRYQDFTTVLVDNASWDGTVEATKHRFPDVRIVETGDNLGYTGGNAAGVRFALGLGADYVFILNNDTTVAPDGLDHLVDYAETHPDAGIVGPKVYMYDQPHSIWFAGAAFDRYGTLVHTDFGQPDQSQADEAVESAYIPGCSMLIKRSLIEHVGFLEQKFFYLFEEVDLCLRAQRAGYKTVLVPAAKIWHKEARAFGGRADPRYLYYFTRNHLLLIRRNCQGRDRWRLYYYSVRRMYGQWRAFPWRGVQARALVAGTLDFCRGSFGRCPYAAFNTGP